MRVQMLRVDKTQQECADEFIQLPGGCVRKNQER